MAHKYINNGDVHGPPSVMTDTAATNSWNTDNNNAPAFVRAADC